MKQSTSTGIFVSVAVFLSVFATTFMFLASQATAEETPDEAKPWAYTVGPEDVLMISVWKNKDLSGEVIVRPDGMITLPLIGDVIAAGKTPSELREMITNMLLEFQRSVVVSVIAKQINSYRIFILGEVKTPGPYTLKRKTYLLQAIAMAGGFNQFASENKIVLIREKEGGADGSKKIRIRFSDIVDEDEAKDQNLILKPGDTIFVP